jgi:hypothetical protein
MAITPVVKPLGKCESLDLLCMYSEIASRSGVFGVFGVFEK